MDLLAAHPLGLEVAPPSSQPQTASGAPAREEIELRAYIRKGRFSGVIAIWFSRASHSIAQSNVGSFPFAAIFSSLRDCSLLVLSASQMAPAVLPISSSIVIPFPSHNPHRTNTHHLRPIEAGEACSREPDPRPRKRRYILLLSILLRREMPLRISFTISS